MQKQNWLVAKKEGVGGMNMCVTDVDRNAVGGCKEVSTYQDYLHYPTRIISQHS